MRRSRSPHVSHVTRADDEGNGPPEFMCHMWMHERPPMIPAMPGDGEMQPSVRILNAFATDVPCAT